MKSNFNKFFIIWIGQLFSNIGSGLTAFALGVYVLQQTHKTSSYAFLLLCIFLPPFILKPLGGILADRYDRRLVMILSDFGSSLGLAFIFVQILTGHIEIWQIYLGVVLSSVFSAFQEPAYKASISDFLSKEDYEKASGLVQFSSSAQYLFSPFIAGLLLSYAGLKSIFITDIATFLFASFTMLILRNKIVSKQKITDTQDSSLLAFKEGLVELRKQKGVMSLVVVITMIMFFTGLLQSLFSPMLLSFTNEKIMGISQSLAATGMLLGSLFIGIFGKSGKKATLLAGALFVCGLFFAGIGVSIKVPVITFMGFLFFSSLPFINTSIEVLIRNHIENAKQGRVWANIATITFFGSIVAFAISGFLADKIFNPLLIHKGLLVHSLGRIVGVGDNRGIGLIFVISGSFISILGFLIWKSKNIRSLEV